MPIQMTRAEYEAKYGSAPGMPQSSGPIKMTRAEYAAKYGNNIQPVTPATTPDPTSGVTNAGIQKAGGQAKAFIGGATEGLGGTLPLLGIDYLGKKIASKIPDNLNLKIPGTDLSINKKKDFNNAPTQIQRFQSTFGKEENPEAYTTGEVAGMAGPLLPSLAKGALKLAGTELGQQAIGKGAELVKGIASKLPDLKTEKAIKHFDDVANAIAPKVTPTSAEALNTKKAGGIMGLNKHDIIDYSNDPQMVKAYQAVKKIYVPGETAGANKNIIQSHIEDIAENKVKPFLSANKVPFHFQDLRDSFDNISPSSALKANPEALGTYNRIKEDLLSTIASAVKKAGSDPLKATDMNELWNARKIVDKKIQQELGIDLGEAHIAGAKAAAQDFRQQFAKFIDNSLRYPGQMDKLNKAESISRELASRGQPVEDMAELYRQLGIKESIGGEQRMKAFRDAMDKMSSMYHAVDGLSTKIKGDLGKSSLSVKYPKAVKFGKFLGGATIGGGVVGGGISALSN